MKKSVKFHLTKKSDNKKTGQIPVSTSPQNTCPDNCPLKKKGCYANSGPLLLHWKKISCGERGVSWKDFLKQVESIPTGTFWRHNQAGDLVGMRDMIDQQKLTELVTANGDKKGFTYTHYPVEGKSMSIQQNREAIKEINHHSKFTINLSSEGLEQADRLANLQIGPVTVTIPANSIKNLRTPELRKVVVCPAATHDDITCEKCQMCANKKRTWVIGFPAHGAQKNKIEFGV